MVVYHQNLANMLHISVIMQSFINFQVQRTFCT